MDDFVLVKPAADPGAEPRLVSRATLERWPDDYVPVQKGGAQTSRLDGREQSAEPRKGTVANSEEN